MPVHGGDKWLSRLNRMRDLDKVADEWAYASAADVALEARNLVNENGVPSPNHVVSDPYSPPNTDSGHLQSLIQPVELAGTGHAAAISSAEYALALEFGTTRMIERPYMRVASANRRKAVLEDAANRLRKFTSRAR